MHGFLILSPFKEFSDSLLITSVPGELLPRAHATAVSSLLRPLIFVTGGKHHFSHLSCMTRTQYIREVKDKR